MSNNLLESLWARVSANIGDRIDQISGLLTQALSASAESKAARDAAATSAGEAKDHADRAEQATDLTSLRNEVTQQIAAVVDGSPAALDTIREVAEYAQANRGITDQLNAAIGDKANKSHTHAVGDVTGLGDALDGKADAVHTHTTSQITDYPGHSAYSGPAFYGKIPVREPNSANIQMTDEPSEWYHVTNKAYVDARPAIFTVPDINSASTENLVPGDVVVDTSTWIFYYLK